MVKVMDFVCELIATGFYSGYSRYAPGTIGSFLAMVLTFFYFNWFAPSLVINLLVWIVLAIVGWYSAYRFEHRKNLEDPSCVVVDEILGYFSVFVLWSIFSDDEIPFIWLVIGFTLFRFFDIVKPLYISTIDHKLKNKAFGTMLDDLIAGFYSFICIIIFKNIISLFV